jgi:DNA polymerase III psi subunit
MIFEKLLITANENPHWPLMQFILASLILFKDQILCSDIAIHSYIEAKACMKYIQGMSCKEETIVTLIVTVAFGRARRGYFLALGEVL